MASSDMNLRSLGELLGEFSFEIPDYQRGYSWTQPQWQALWRDVRHLEQNNLHQHFTGMMLVRRLEHSAKAPTLELIDGQQRLVTSMVFANALRARLEQKAQPYAINFNDNPEFQDYFSFYALNRLSVEARLARDASSYALNLKAAAHWFTEQADQLTPKQADAMLTALLDKCCLFMLEVSSRFDLHVAFETLNNRGRPLSKMELLKNRLIYLTTVLPPQEQAATSLREQIHSAWKGIYRALGRSAKTQNHDDEFLQAHTTAYFGRSREADWLDKVLFETQFCIDNAELSFAAINEYIQSLETAAVWWSHVHAPEQLPKALQKHLDRLTHCGFGYFKPLILAACLRIANDLPGATVRPAEFAKALSPLETLFEQIERFVVIVFRLLGNRGTYGKADVDWAAYELSKAGRSGFLSDHYGMTATDAAGVIRFAADWLKAYICNMDPASDEYLDERFDWEGAFSQSALQSSIDKRFQKGDGYYNWDFTRLALFEYESHFQLEGNHPPKVAWSTFSFDETVEHIFPQNPSGLGLAYWNEQIPIDGRSNRGGKLSKALQNSLGNLLLLSRSSNAAASNEAYWLKSGREESGKRVRFRNASYSATEVAQQYQQWNTQSIAVRGISLLKFIEQRWSICLSETPEDLQSYLPLCFGPQTEAVKDGKTGKLSSRSLKAKP
ncbi:DUF262 domain-containing protein [Pseudomonas sp. DTU_2021_1001937_2_SI_NGA_ILE_001]|uniref:DUF262 domain-containing protein n=1 Tax=Pseudomonas sp. DTU_2021_1001937_2_SI_NGA_ILE_001 TaxID=3077589 RepID=UPI0028FC2E56|nr:DUF262 domain-containing protein [Pseudomonas sp. DTU_2021_1001937_2_SI_NGA_ILE_001]WNW10564.1 DUF262 domain-containing protein [Pseudomonas sp. DTU_2021_1001937_2_SI_NGA_ILE_001]